MHGVSIITCTIRPQFMDEVFKNYSRQNWENKELIIILNKDDIDAEIYKQEANKYTNVTVYQLSEDITLGECLNYGIDHSQFRYVAKFDDDDYYGSNYLTQAMEAFNKTDAVIVGKRTIYTYFKDEKALTISAPGRENQYINKILKGPTLVIDKSIHPQIKFPNKNLSEDVGIQRLCMSQGLKMFATDKQNFVYIRHDNKMHTSHKVNENLLKNYKIIAYTDDFVKYLNME